MTDLAEYLLPASPEPGDRWRWATVTGVDPVRVRLDGETAPLDITPDVLGPVRVGDRVWCQQHGRRLVAHTAVPFPFRESAGTVNVPLTSGVGSIGVTFPVGRFTVAPFVFPAAVASSAGGWSVTHAGASTGGVTIHVRNVSGASSAAINVRWHAIQMTPEEAAG